MNVCSLDEIQNLFILFVLVATSLSWSSHAMKKNFVFVVLSVDISGRNFNYVY